MNMLWGLSADLLVHHVQLVPQLGDRIDKERFELVALFAEV